MAEIKHRHEGVNLLPVASGVVIKYKDYFGLSRIYALMHEWLIQEGWCTRADEKFKEIFYLHREKQKGGDEVQWWWRLDRLPHPGDEYFKYELDINAKIILLESVEVIQDNKKFKTNKGEIELTLNAYLILDHKKIWAKHPMLSHFHKLYMNRIKKNTIETVKKELYWEVFRLQDAIKTYLQQSTYLPEAEFGKFEPVADYSG